MRKDVKMKVAIFTALLVTMPVIMLRAQFQAGIQSDSTNIQKETARKVKDRFDTIATVDKYGVATSMPGDSISLPLTEDEPLERVYQFLEQNRDIFRLEDARQELHLRYPRVQRNGQMSFKFDQFYNEVLVKGGFLGIGILPDSIIIIGINCKIFPQARSVNTTPTVTKEQAIDIALGDTMNVEIPPGIHPNRNSISPNIELLIEIRDGVAHLEWPLSVFVCGPTYYIDAHTGAILEIKNEVIE